MLTKDRCPGGWVSHRTLRSSLQWPARSLTHLEPGPTQAKLEAGAGRRGTGGAPDFTEHTKATWGNGGALCLGAGNCF